MNRTHSRARGLVAALLIVAALAGVPVLLVALGAKPWTIDLADLRLRLLSPDDGSVALIIIGATAWIAWAVMAFCLLTEIVAAVRGVRAPRLRGLGAGQHLASQLVASAAVLFAVAQPLSLTLAAAPAHADNITEVQTTPPAASLAEPIAEATPPPALPAKSAPATDSYTTRAHDSLWKIAEAHLGDGTRFTEIVDLNPDLFPDGPGFLTAGTVLQLPASEATTAVDPEDSPYVVEPGDTLWDIADEKLGDPTRYDEIFEASDDIIQPDGHTLTDPDLIYPGWELEIPDDAPRVDETPQETTPRDSTPNPPPQTAPTVPPESTPAPPPPDVESPANTAVEEQSSDLDENSATPTWLLPGLTGAGTVLAGSLFLVLRAHRRTQLRYRSPGEVIEPPPQELVAVEKTARLSAGTVLRLQDLDRLLRHLADGLELTRQPQPHLQHIELADRCVTLHLAGPAAPPPGWGGTDDAWTFELDQPLPDPESPAPWPLLCTIGATDDGYPVLANLEELGTITLTGDQEAATALARSMTAELTLSPWGILTDIDTVGVATELADLDPVRLHHHEPDDVGFLDRLSAELATRGDNEPEMFHAVIASDVDAAEPLIRVIADSTGRLGATVVTSSNSPVTDSVSFHLTGDSRLHIQDLGLHLTSAGLTADEAAATAAIVAVTRDAAPVPTPVHDAQEPAWRAATDRSGNLVTAYADAPPSVQEVVHTADDIADTAPEPETVDETSGPSHQKSSVALDPTLDHDVAAWFDADSRVPKLHLLGPVRATAHGNPAAVARRKPHYVELLTYLALHPEGVSSQQVAEAFSMSKDRVRIDIGVVRKWLGENPRTSRPYLPPAAQSRAAGEAGVWTYQVDDVLVDADLFRRLRARGQSRGDDGQQDFDTALRLVQGPPFADLRETGWSWLLDADSRDDEILACSIVDVAHDVVTAALRREDVDRAAQAVETATVASPYDEIARVDRAAVLVAQGHEDAAREFLAAAVHNRSDDSLGPLEVSIRTSVELSQGTKRPKD
ncbi:LysM peptidoglycan-binding domain-containing protein [Aeromicrobium piscarium]|uniref:LysM peptidoglycan-binding domain-containing protein n=1 Tax=Aeromicrobium piscarium TaxID=2590901 RepID=A0A554SHA0_9ACTN|nr:LysM peptidoglycan-binding domain-containing protein [Aeromicrobium piscarium]TSD65719.1 LysM peptidoglycan-binding domain-containing protein [Aeromicrobium piscarium]